MHDLHIRLLIFIIQDNTGGYPKKEKEKKGYLPTLIKQIKTRKSYVYLYYTSSVMF